MDIALIQKLQMTMAKNWLDLEILKNFRHS